MIAVEWVRIVDLGAHGEAGLLALAGALEQLAIAQALVMLHGQAEGARRYAASGGCVRFDEQGEPLWPLEVDR